MIFRIYPNRDTSITNFRRFGVPQTGSNAGASEILEVFKQAHPTVSSSISRVLLGFDLSEFQSLVSAGQFPTASVSWSLHLTSAKHSGETPTSYDMEVQALSQDWDEGRGHDLISYADKGFANWDKAKSNLFWTVPGASGSGPIAVQHYDTGHEDMNVGVTSIVSLWLTGSMVNNGFLVKVSSTQESDGSDYYTKRFHGRSTHFLDRRPYLEASWNDVVMTGSVQQASGTGLFFVAVPNLKDSYHLEESPVFRLFVRNRDYNPAVVLTASSDPVGLVVPRAYYRITNDRTDEVVVPFGTGSDSTRLSYDSNGNYFRFFMSCLSPREIYRIVFLFDFGTNRQLVDQNLKFRVVE